MFRRDQSQLDMKHTELVRMDWSERRRRIKVPVKTLLSNQPVAHPETYPVTPVAAIPTSKSTSSPSPLTSPLLMASETCSISRLRRSIVRRLIAAYLSETYFNVSVRFLIFSLPL